jgi:tricorn protease
MTSIARRFLPGLFLFCTAITLSAAPRHLLQHPALSQKQIVFAYAGDLWSVARTGGTATRLTSGIGVESEPAFSPDGQTVAFTGEYDGNVDVFTVPAAGGSPKRITHHPDADNVVGWTPDGKRIIFRSTRESYSRYTKLFTVSTDGGLPEAMPLPMGYSGAYSPDGKKFVYAPLGTGGGFGNFTAWKRYRGGRASYLWLADMSTLDTVKIPRTDSQDFNPMWLGDRIYFLSDRTGKVSLFRYDPATMSVTDVVKNTGYDINSANAGGGGIVYDQFGEIHVFDVKTGKSSKIDIEVTGDMPEVRPRFLDVSAELRNGRISPTGARAVFEAHGEVLTLPAAKGDFRNLTNTPGVMERTPAWSPDGQSVAYFSDESGEYALHIRAQNGAGEPKKIAISKEPAYYVDPQWSPDSKFVAFHDNRLNFWLCDVAAGKITKLDTDRLNSNETDAAWSPDSKWLAFSKGLGNRLRAIYVYSLESGKMTQVTDGMSDARYPAFDRDGQYLYFAASTNYGTSISGLDMSSDAFSTTRSIYAVVLSAEGASPVAPESDEEKSAAERAAAVRNERGTGSTMGSETARPAKPVRIDLENIGQRIVALPIPPRSFADLQAGKAGVLFLLESGASGRSGQGLGRTLHKYSVKSRKLETFAQGLASCDVSADGEKILVSMIAAGAIENAPPGSGEATPRRTYAIIGTTMPMKPGEGVLRTANLQVRTDPMAEWQQMYREVWRIESAFFYDSKFHGVNIQEAQQTYAQYVDGIAARADLNYIFQEMLGEFTVGHMRGGGGALPNPKRIPGGLLGADYEIANGLYRLKRIYSGESWNPQLRSPLVQPGLKVAKGDTILAVNGQNLTAADDISRLLEATANRTVVLKLASDASGTGSHEVSVVPVASETALRNLSWVEDNRRKVDQLSGGKLAYAYMPDTALGGLTSFNRYFFAQTDRQGVILDERFNSGGQVADYVIEVLKRPLMSWWKPRYGDIYKTPAGSIQGPKVMVTNEFAGSGGDAMPWLFRQAKLGTLVGKRTWGGLVGVGAYPPLMDGGSVTAPSFRFFTPAGEWDVENHGVAPDVEVELDPKLVASGHDPQLEKAVAIAMAQLEKQSPAQPKVPKFPDYHHPASNTSGAGGN